ncbi:MAG: phytase [Nocardioides sp.]
MRRFLVRTTLVISWMAGVMLVTPWAVPATPALDVVPSTGETTPVLTAGDSADDPAIWVNRRNPDRSLVIVNNKQGALETYDLAGNRVQRLTDGVRFWGNVDVRAQVPIGGVTRDLVAVAHRGLQLYTVNQDTRLLQSITEGRSLPTSGEGVCLYRSPVSARTYAIVITITGRLRQYELNDPDQDGRVSGTLVRDIQVGSEAEGCVADDSDGSLYVSEEDVALWRYGAEPGAGAERIAVDRVVAAGGELEPDIEGVTLADTPAGRYLFVSAQRIERPYESYFVAYQVLGGNTWSRDRAFRVGKGSAADDCDRTDGIAAYAGDLGPRFPHGIFVCQDNSNAVPGTVGNQNVKFVPLESILTFLG